jgi:hypothetical protein
MEARPFLADMVEREKRRTGSKMVAYETVASLIGRSSSWVRKAIPGYDGLGLDHRVFVKIAAAYIRLCGHFEAAGDKEREAIAALLERANAAVESNTRLVAVAQRAAGDRTRDQEG